MNISNRKNINIEESKITVIGFGRSGEGAALLGHYLGANMFISDGGSTDTMVESGKKLEAFGIQIETGGHTEKIYNTDLWVVSPGIAQDAEIVLNAKAKSIPIVSEIEFASWFTDAPIISLTGSNGKTTSVHLLNKMCQTESLSPALSGNVGTAFSEIVLADLKDKPVNRIHVLEISSFQMEHIVHFKPLISVFLNITPDHLDRYANMDDYIQAKLSMIKNQNGTDHIIYNFDDPILKTKFDGALPQTHGFSILGNGETVFTMNATKIYDEKHATLIQLDQLALPGQHNLANALAAATAAKFMDVPNLRIAQVMSSFMGVEHRLERVLDINGVTYYNDSKATNVDAVKVALDSFDSSIHLILGGKDKGGEFSQLLPHAQNKVKEIVAYGQAGEKISTALRDAVKLEQVSSLRDAVEICHQRAVPGDIILLSPGCASFDQFTNFEERGDVFKSLVKDLV
ncbi:MAG: UDP-N-acetylmuramoyl-L-alanine--D-glutamate ligase [Candidatus Marinimicrobia bacterium]|jgi:UDP-N-acetylmuramoylalanine--D-glutamate ligase|nr:UDP-N-acetylmuramoyl-L-alanine--D-glutamate ligase [Candidatus Neomarinimicrobiota bacterium]MBT3676092.1 UDP-N-acetylmuramoyl-L-alanine--D-glutamate ligase [Candidatus Neomarinimicrobiota bacterium]MBT3764020.1 UDP-N-acetylmuramoyl-L-alanine--D-glutamate ligase [Candidatus Neomarinimicrobiota bacterium]MBT4067759.1 UDP-N-acetylmuramoyl-L-alanine--D-glutamate ligase [Candidatus Neomarinimicrobiota bacterium]MBT4270773.1 UDP-N-acetylmuramoyl-L-alanine--D-glutamate ligase [Candidatus Neomarini